jgi:hypothetical protein
MDLPCRLEAELPPWKPTESYLSLLTTESHSTPLTTYIRLLLITPTLKGIIQFQNRLYPKVGTKMPNALRHKLIKIVMPTRPKLERDSGSYTPKQLERMEQLGIKILPPLKEHDTNLEGMRRYCCASICVSVLKIMLALYTSHSTHPETVLEAGDHSHATFQRMTTEAYIFLSILKILVALYCFRPRQV